MEEWLCKAGLSKFVVQSIDEEYDEVSEIVDMSQEVALTLFSCSRAVLLLILLSHILSLSLSFSLSLSLYFVYLSVFLPRSLCLRVRVCACHVSLSVNSV